MIRSGRGTAKYASAAEAASPLRFLDRSVDLDEVESEVQVKPVVLGGEDVGALSRRDSSRGDVDGPCRPLLAIQDAIEHHRRLASHRRQVVAFRIEEEIVEEVRRRLEGRWIAGPKALVNFEDRLFRRVDLVLKERVSKRCSAEQFVDEQNLDLVNPAIAKLFDLFGRELLVRLDDHLARLRIDHVVSRDPTDDLFRSDRNVLEPRRLDLLDRSPSEFPSLLHEKLVVRRMTDVARRLHTGQLIGLEDFRDLAIVENDHVFFVKVIE